MSDSQGAARGDGAADGGGDLRPPTRPPGRTPLYEAQSSSRYERQLLVEQVQALTGRRLICYVAGGLAPIDRDDAMGFADLLYNVGEKEDLDLLLHTSGGDIDAAEKIVHMVRKRVGTAMLRVVVPDFAKSAGTLIALGADRVVMSDTSELGPIDPQIDRRDRNGNCVQHSIQHYLAAYDTHRRALLEHPESVPDQIMFGKLEPETVKLFEAYRERALKFAERALQQGMFRTVPGPWTRVAKAFLDTRVGDASAPPVSWQTHGQLISADAAEYHGLLVERLSHKDPLWAKYWHLYCRQRLALRPDQKLFESDHVSLIVEQPT